MPKTENAKENASAIKDEATKEEVKDAIDPATQKEVPEGNPNKPTEILGESADETHDRHAASLELPAGEVTPPESQALKTDEDGEPLNPITDDAEDHDGSLYETAEADEGARVRIPGAASGPKADGTILNDAGKVAWAPPGSHNAAMAGVQQDASGHADSVGTDNSHHSGTRR